MRRTINISVPEELHTYILDRSRYTTVSEYIRTLVRSERQRRADYGGRQFTPLRANENYVLANALEQLDKLKSILEQNDPFDI